MMPPNLTDDQKEHIRIAQRAHMRVEETWTLFNLFLTEGKKPDEALQKAQEAVAVWSEWMDSNQVEFPEIEQPNYAQQLGQAMKTVFAELPKMPETARLLLEAAARLSDTERPDGSTQTKSGVVE